MWFFNCLDKDLGDDVLKANAGMPPQSPGHDRGCPDCLHYEVGGEGGEQAHPPHQDGARGPALL